MRTTARTLTGPALAVAWSGALGVLGTPAAHAADATPLDIRPAAAAPGTAVSVSTSACGRDGHGTGDAESLGAGDFTVSPGKDQQVAAGRFTVPKGAQPGNYGITVLCDDGKEADGDLLVQAAHGQPSGQLTTSTGRAKTPSGHVETGVGGSVGPDTTQIAAGVALLAATAVGGTRTLRRRASGAQGS
ncbi:hypothetical protein [Streptomyces sp. NPDC059176]|uniref:hypothetical protein n=1 Tax=unclassified Streptomyces TaxID=2593676 RepID=UPI00368B0996